MRYLEYSNLYRQKGEWWLPGAKRGRNWKLLFNGYRVLQAEKILEIGCNDMNVLNTTELLHLKMAKMAKFVLRVFYHN